MAVRQNEVLLSGEFTKISKKKCMCKVTVSKDCISYRSLVSTNSVNETTYVQTSDIIGCRSEKPTDGEDVCSTWVTIISYPFRKKVFSNKRSRYRLVVTFEIKITDDFEENSALADRWVNVINCLARDVPVSVEDVSTCVPPKRGKLLILINPHSGPGKALSIFKQEVLPMITDADLPYKMIVTDHAGHGRELMLDLVLDEWYGVVIISGDGLIYEVINGLMAREDWKSAIKLPVGCLPGGSGNALCCSINYSAGEPVLNDLVLHSTFVLIKHRIIPMDLVFIQSPSQNYYSFLSLTWGLIADIDYESEKYRSIGEARFAVGAIKRIIGLRSYHTRLSFLPVAEYIPKSSGSPENNKSSKLLTKIRRFSIRSRSNSKTTISSMEDNLEEGSLTEGQGSTVNNNMSNGAAILPDTESININNFNNSNNVNGTEINDNIATEVNNEATTQSRKNQEKGNPLGMDQSVIDICSAISMEKEIITAAAENGDTQIEQEVIVATKREGKPVPTPLLKPLSDPVPEDWVTIDDQLILAAALYQTHLGSDMLAAPNAHINDGFIHLLIVREGISRNALLNMFMSFGEGRHVDSPYVELIQCLAFRLEPMSPGGNIMIDGERCDPCPIQGQVLPGMSKLMAIK